MKPTYRTVLVGYTPLSVHLPQEHVAPSSTQSAEVVDVEDCFALGQIQPNMRDSNVSQIVREPRLKVVSSLQLLAPDENGRYTTR